MLYPIVTEASFVLSVLTESHKLVLVVKRSSYVGEVQYHTGPALQDTS